MKKLILTLGIVLLFGACDNDSMENETNPYPDGVYPFEVTGVSQTKVESVYTVTWTTPDSISKVDLDMFIIMGDVAQTEMKVYSSNPLYESDLYRNYVLKKDSFSFIVGGDGTNKYVTIKCVDKFGNVSNGVRYDFPNP